MLVLSCLYCNFDNNNDCAISIHRNFIIKNRSSISQFSDDRYMRFFFADDPACCSFCLPPASPPFPFSMIHTRVLGHPCLRLESKVRSSAGLALNAAEEGWIMESPPELGQRWRFPSQTFLWQSSPFPDSGFQISSRPPSRYLGISIWAGRAEELRPLVRRPRLAA